MIVLVTCATEHMLERSEDAFALLTTDLGLEIAYTHRQVVVLEGSGWHAWLSPRSRDSVHSISSGRDCCRHTGAMTRQ